MNSSTSNSAQPSPFFPASSPNIYQSEFVSPKMLDARDSQLSDLRASAPASPPNPLAQTSSSFNSQANIRETLNSCTS